jgi:PAS domain S-box-containing protein
MATQLLPDTAPLSAHPLVGLARTRLGFVLQLVALGVLHYAALKFRNALPFNHAPISFADGVAVAGLVLLGIRAFPAIAISAFAHYTKFETFELASVAYAAGVTISPMVAAIGLQLCRWNDTAFERLRDVIRFVAVAALLAPLVGVAVILLIGLYSPKVYQVDFGVMLPQYLAGVMGILLVAPPLLTWLGARPTDEGDAGPLELVGLFCGVVVAALLGRENNPLFFLPTFPLLCWAGLRTGSRGTTLVSLALFVVVGLTARTLLAQGEGGIDRLIFVAGVNLSQGVTVLLLAATMAEHRRSRRQEREVNESYRTLVAAAPFGVIGINRAGEVTLWSSAAEQIYGWSAEEIVGRPLPTVPSSKRDEFAAMLGHPSTMNGYETVRRHKDGHELEISLTTWPLYDAHLRPIGAMGVHHDITERKRAAEKLRLSEDQLRQALKMEAIGRLAGGVAHDFNNLLTSVLGHAGLALEAVDRNNPVHDDLLEIQAAGGRAAQLTQQLLAFSRKQVLEPRLLDLNTVVTGIARMLRRTIGEDVELATRLAQDLGTVRADAVQMEQVLLNLAVNARDAMPDGGRLTIETSNVHTAEAQLVRVKVHDTGMGMSGEVRAHLFEPFYTTKDVGKGTGLGLATAYGIVRQSGGDISVESEPGRGSTFIVDLPMVRGEPTPVEPVVEFVPRGGTETILMVEDEESVRSLTRRVLELQGYRVLSAASGELALEISRNFSGRIHLLLTDVVMPGITGPKLADILLAERQGLRLIYMSGYAATMLERGIRLSPETAFLQKPFTTDILMRRVREVLDAELVAQR